MLCFNPHTHAGCDNIFLTVCNTPLSFNPHTHAGCDFLDKVIISYFKVSIHTPTQGVTVAKVFGGYMCFVSIHTPTQGVTLYLSIRVTDYVVSIHTPTQGVTGY